MAEDLESKGKSKQIPLEVQHLETTLSRRSGVRLDAAKLDHELALRGVTARRLAEVAGVPEVTLSRARHGRPVTESTLRRITTGLLSIPLMLGADLVLAAPAGKPAP